MSILKHISHFHRHARHTPFAVILLITLFFSAQIALTIYIDSSFLANAIKHSSLTEGDSLWKNPEDMVGTIYTVGSLLTILTLLIAPKYLTRFGNYRSTLAAIIIHMLMLLGLSMTDSILFVIPMFIATNILTAVLFFNIDIFIERYSTNNDTGRIRGMFMALTSLAWLIPPLFAGYLVDVYGFHMVYLVGAFLILPMIYLTMKHLSGFQDLKYDHESFFETRKEVLRNRDLSSSLMVNFFIHFFYAWMIIYAPIYLSGIGFAWDQIGLMITIALLAFVIFPYPEGVLADKYIGEKELLTIGFLLMAVTSFTLPLLGIITAPFWLWTLTLFLGRVGASTTETMSETYFFKQIDGKNPQLVGYFRRTRALAFIAAPIFASVLLESGYIELSGLFPILGVTMLIAIFFVLRLKDTK